MKNLQTFITVTFLICISGMKISISVFKSYGSEKHMYKGFSGIT